MEVLSQNDSFVNGTHKEYSQIVKVALGKEFQKELSNFMVDNCMVRGGLFWSARLDNVVPGKINNGKVYPFKDFIQRLKNTVNN